MSIRIAKTAGLCFGVKRAVGVVNKMLAGGEKIATLGPIIHNPQVVDDFAARGVIIADELAEIPKGYKAVIRSHGVERHVYDKLDELGIPYFDATCPDVGKIRKLARDESLAGAAVLIMGNENHPEVKGIESCCCGECDIFKETDQFTNFINTVFSAEKSYILLAQTTFNSHEWQKCVEIAKKQCTNIKIFDTICEATILRQEEAAALAGESDAVLVVGGKTSSNTNKLAEICRKYCPTFLIESPDDLKGLDLKNYQSIAITAGASTPASIIKEVTTSMSEILNQQDEQSFEEMLEQSFKTINSREKVTAVVTNVSPNEIAVDIGTKHAGYVPLYEYTEDPSADLTQLVKVGDEIELMVLRINDVEGTAMLSKKRLDAIAGFEKVMEAEQSGEILEGTIVDVVKGGVIALTNGVRVFIPASQATASRGQELETLLKQKVKFKILETNRQRRRAVGSIRAVLKDLRKDLEEKFWKDVEVGKTYKGTVKSLTNYGAFVDLGGVDGMAHISELSWNRVKHPSDVFKVGDEVEVYVKELDPETKKISLGYKKDADNPWEILANQFKSGDVCKAKIVSMTPFGAFAQVTPGVDGLIHISQISNQRIAKPGDVLSVGQEVDVKITDIDYDKKRVSLSMRALIEPVENPEQDDTEPKVYVAGPDSAKNTADAAKEAVSNAIDAVEDAAQPVLEAVKAGVESLADAVMEIAAGAKDAVEKLTEESAEAKPEVAAEESPEAKPEVATENTDEEK